MLELNDRFVAACVSSQAEWNDSVAELCVFFFLNFFLFTAYGSYFLPPRTHCPVLESTAAVWFLSSCVRGVMWFIELFKVIKIQANVSFLPIPVLCCKLEFALFFQAFGACTSAAALAGICTSFPSYWSLGKYLWIEFLLRYFITICSCRRWDPILSFC